MEPLDHYADESKYLILVLELNPNLNACAVSHKALYDEGCTRFFRWLSTGTQEPGAKTEGTGTIDQEDAPHKTGNKIGRVWTYTTIEDEQNIPRPHYPRSLDSLELSDVHMGDAGFEALVRWLESVRADDKPKFALTKLRLRFNEIEGTAQLAEEFVSALSFSSPSWKVASSSLSSLILSNNPLSPDFKQTLFGLLPQIQSLSSLHLTMTGLTTADALALASYIANQERRCKLIELHANSNSMGYRGVRAVVKAMQHCWTMEKVEMYANDNEDEVAPDAKHEDSDEDWAVQNEDNLMTSLEAITSFAIGSGCGWSSLQLKMKHILARNVFLKRQTARQALRLLKYSRLMLRPNISASTSSRATQSCDACDCLPAPVSTSDSARTPSSAIYFNYLPTEIQLSILSQLAPLLTTTQRLRIFEFAVDHSTLPSLRLCLPPSNKSASSEQDICVPDPGSHPYRPRIPGGLGRKSGSLLNQRDEPSTLRNIHACGSGNCMGNKSVLCKRKTDRQKWLELVGCDSYDPGSPTN